MILVHELFTQLSETIAGGARPSYRLLSLVLVLMCVSSSPGQTRPGLIDRSIDETRRHTLAGNTRPEAGAGSDAGVVEGDLPMEHMFLQLKRSDSDEAAVKDYIDSLHNPRSPNYHRWMTASEFGSNFGAAEPDRAAIVGWLESNGFTVHGIGSGGMTIDFSGTAGQVSKAFRTEIHYLQSGGVRHIANMTDPSIPEALAPVVAGIVSLHDFSPRPMKHPHPEYTYTNASGGVYHLITPGDLAVIYDLFPLFAAGITGTGQTIAVIEDTDLYSAADWTTFRSTFGLNKYTSGTLTTVHPAGSAGANNCSDPGVVAGDDEEAAIDAEWASAAAPNASIWVDSCAGTRTTFGGYIALHNLVNSKAPPPIVSISYGECEAQNGAASNAAFSSLYQQAVAEGISVFVSGGDFGAAACDANATGATHGIGVSAFASTPYNVAVGGTDLGDNAAGTTTAFWSAVNSSTFASALSYVPEIPWNDSCASSLIIAHFGYSAAYGSAGFCSSTIASKNGLIQVLAGGGGPSGCATGSPVTAGVVGGTCKGFAKPAWQTGIAGIPSDGVRDIPDISLFAATGHWGHYYVDCWSDIRNGGASCAGAPVTWDGGGGTSYTAPIAAGIQALVNQKQNGPQGNPNYVYYRLAARAGSLCPSAAVTNAGCIFHNIVQGDNDVNCGGTNDCFGATQSVLGGILGRLFGFGESYNGALSTSSKAFSPAFKSSSGWNFATGLGSVDVFELVTNWRMGEQ